MTRIKKYLSNENFNLIIKNRFLIKAMFLVLINGCNRKSLELVRLSLQLKQVKDLTNKINRSKHVKEHVLSDDWCKSKHEVVWVCWFQGESSAPELVKLCLKSIKKVKGKRVVVVTKDNYKDFVDLPEYVVEKWKKGIISHAHFSDLLRMELLFKHGGIWLDATVFISSDTLPDYLENSWLFLFQSLKPGADGRAVAMSSWAMSSGPGNPVLALTRGYLFEYWRVNNKLYDYFLFHLVVTSILDLFPEYCARIDKVCNSTPHILQLEMVDDLSNERVEQIMNLTCVHKLTHKQNLSKDKLETLFINSHKGSRETKLQEIT